MAIPPPHNNLHIVACDKAGLRKRYNPQTEGSGLIMDCFPTVFGRLYKIYREIQKYSNLPVIMYTQENQK